MRCLARRVELFHPMPIDRLHHSYPRKDHRAVVLRGLRHHASGGLDFWHCVFGLRNILSQPGDGLFERAQLPAVRQFDWFVELAMPVHPSSARHRKFSTRCSAWAKILAIHTRTPRSGSCSAAASLADTFSVDKL